MKWQKLRRKYPEFIYKSFSWKIVKNNLEISFDFRIPPNISFNPNIRIKNGGDRVSAAELDNFVFHLGLIEMFSYWKATASPIIKVECGYLDNWQKKWWLDLLKRGMGQFFFENKIDFRKPNFVRIISKHEQ